LGGSDTGEKRPAQDGSGQNCKQPHLFLPERAGCQVAALAAIFWKGTGFFVENHITKSLSNEIFQNI
jgi:hypothetical protein